MSRQAQLNRIDMVKGHDCKHCNLGNPCIGCADYDMWNDTCISKGACGDPDKKYAGE